MYFDWRLFGLTRGVRLRILFAAFLGLIAVGAGVSRLAVSGVVIYRVLSGQASFSALALPLSIIAVLIVVRSLFQYWQNAVSHHTANIVKISLRHEVYERALKLGPGYFDRNRTGDVVLTLVEGIERLETFFGQYLSQIIVSAIAPIAIFAYMVTLDVYIALIFLAFAFLTLAVPAMFTPGTGTAASGVATRTVNSARTSWTAFRGWQRSRRLDRVRAEAGHWQIAPITCTGARWVSSLPTERRAGHPSFSWQWEQPSHWRLGRYVSATATWSCDHC